MIEDRDYSASEYRRFPQNYSNKEVNRNLKKPRKLRWFLAFSSFMLMISLGFAIYNHHFDIILSPFKWALLAVSSYLFFFLIGMFVGLINVHPEFKD